MFERTAAIKSHVADIDAIVFGYKTQAKPPCAINKASPPHLCNYALLLKNYDFVWFRCVFATLYKTNEISTILTYSLRTCWWTASPSMRSRIVFVMEIAKFIKIYKWLPDFDSRGQFIDSRRQNIEREHHFNELSLQKQWFPDTTNCKCCSDHCKRNVFWFHEIVKKWQCALNTNQKHICAHSKTSQIQKTISGVGKTYNCCKMLSKPMWNVVFWIPTVLQAAEMLLWST